MSNYTDGPDEEPTEVLLSLILEKNLRLGLMYSTDFIYIMMLLPQWV